MLVLRGFLKLTTVQYSAFNHVVLAAPVFNSSNVLIHHSLICGQNFKVVCETKRAVGRSLIKKNKKGGPIWNRVEHRKIQCSEKNCIDT